MQVTLENAFVLHRRSYRESSLLVELFSEQHGRIGAVAKGAARSMHALQCFQPLLVSWRVRRGELVTLVQFESFAEPVQLDDRATLCGFYFNELLLQALVRNDAHPILFGHYARALHELSCSESDRESVLRLFEWRLLEAMGYGLSLTHDVEDRVIEIGTSYRLQPSIGVVRDVDANARGTPVQGRTLLQLASGALGDAQARQEAKRLMRALLAEHIGDKPLFSRAWFEEY